MPRNDNDSVHFLAYMLIEDEADHLAMAFKVVGPDAVFVTPLYDCGEYQDATSGKTMTRASARAEWKRLLAETTRGWNARDSIDPVYSRVTGDRPLARLTRLAVEFL